MTPGPEHRWRLVAPWYRWERRDGAEPTRAAGAARPALHKYTSTSFVADFLADPQRSVAFSRADEHQRLEAVPHVPLPGDPRRRFLARTRLVPSGVRKLFQPAHQRFYVVAVGLHCDEPGFPRVDPAAVVEAGFVVRRQRTVIPRGAERTAAAVLQELATARALARTRHEADAARARARLLHPFGAPGRSRATEPGAASVAAHRELELARQKVRAWASAAGAERRTEGWVVTGDGSFGAWVPVEEEPPELVERSYLMRTLAPPPDDPGHAAHDGTILWGVVPTASDEATQDGAGRFSEVSIYELRAFVRAKCGDCPGPLVWSEPSEPFHLAAFADPDGCAQRPVEVRLPDLAQLEAATAPPSVRMTAPPGSGFAFPHTGQVPGAGSGSLKQGAEVCFLATPLLTIVATFVVNLFLPVVMFVFGLFWMLKLRFCIPPSAELEALLATELRAVPGGIQGALTADIDLLPGVDAATLWTALRTGLDRDRPGQRLGTTLTAAYTNDPVVELLAGQGYGLPAGRPFPVFAHDLEHTASVTRAQVRPPVRRLRATPGGTAAGNRQAQPTGAEP